jgi:hypothetical protein
VGQSIVVSVDDAQLKETLPSTNPVKVSTIPGVFNLSVVGIMMHPMSLVSEGENCTL